MTTAPAISPVVQTFLDQPHLLFIGGAWVPSVSGKIFETHDPATGKILAQVSEADEPDVNLAVAAARRAFEGPWGARHGARPRRAAGPPGPAMRRAFGGINGDRGAG